MTVVPLGWSRKTWGEIAVLRYGKGLTDYRSSAQGVPVYGTNGQVGRTASAPLCPHAGVVVGRKGAYRGIHYSADPFFVIDTAYWLYPLDQMDLRWAYYQLLTQDINGMDSGSAIPSTSRPDFYALSVLVPPITEQRGIAAWLGSLDDKIESNRRQCSLIDDLLRQEFAAITEHCLVRTPLANLATFTKGVSYRSAELSLSGDTCLVTLKSFGRQGGYQPSGLKPYTGSPKPSQVLTPGELVVAQTDLTQAADVLGRVVRVPSDADPSRLVASLDLVIVRAQGGTSHEYLHGVLLEERFRQHCRSRSSGTTVLHLSRDALPQYEAPNIALVDQERFASSARPLLERHDALGRESVRLAVLRDALLPELLSGRSRVSEAGGVGESALA